MLKYGCQYDIKMLKFHNSKTAKCQLITTSRCQNMTSKCHYVKMLPCQNVKTSKCQPDMT